MGHWDAWRPETTSLQPLLWVTEAHKDKQVAVFLAGPRGLTFGENNQAERGAVLERFSERSRFLHPLGMLSSMHKAQLAAELGLSRSRGLIRALCTCLPAPGSAMLGALCPSTAPWGPAAGHFQTRGTPKPLVLAATRRALPPAVTNARFSEHFKFSLRRKAVFKAFPNYTEAFVISRDFHSPLLRLTLLPDARGMHFPLY